MSALIYIEQNNMDIQIKSSKNNYQFSQQQSKNQSNPLHQRVKHFRIQIRKHQVNNYRNKIRKQLLDFKFIQKMMENMPFDNYQSKNWAIELLKIYADTKTYHFSNDQVINLYRLVQKFPNRETLQLLYTIIVKASVKAVDQIFQYDIMKLLHSVINMSKDKIIRDNTSISNTISSQSQIILNQAITDNITIKRMQSLQPNQSFEYRLSLSQVVLKIITQLNYKSQQIRNFIIDNHKSYTYCYNAYKNFESQIKTQFYLFLQSATKYNFGQYFNQQFRRLSNKIIKLFYSYYQLIVKYGMKGVNINQISNYKIIIMAFTNIFQMKNAWINQKIKSIEMVKQAPILSIIYFVIMQCKAVIMSDKYQLHEVTADLLSYILRFSIFYFQYIQKYSNQQYCLNNIIKFYKIFLQFLRIQDFQIQKMEKGRKSIYFLLCNFLVDQDIHLFMKIQVFPLNQDQNFLTNLLRHFYNETSVENQVQLGNLIFAMIQTFEFKDIFKLIKSSNIIQNLMKILCQDNYKRQFFNGTSHVVQIRIINILKIFLDQLFYYNKEQYQHYRNILYYEYENNMEKILSDCQEQQHQIKLQFFKIYLEPKNIEYI